MSIEQLAGSPMGYHVGVLTETGKQSHLILNLNFFCDILTPRNTWLIKGSSLSTTLPPFQCVDHHVPPFFTGGTHTIQAISRMTPRPDAKRMNTFSYDSHLSGPVYLSSEIVTKLQWQHGRQNKMTLLAHGSPTRGFIPLFWGSMSIVWRLMFLRDGHTGVASDLEVAR